MRGLEKMKFLVDEMLGDVSHWLRMLGYDAKYAKDYEKKYAKENPNESVEDSKLINECLDSNRILLSRDKEMVKIMGEKYKRILKNNPNIYLSFSLETPEIKPYLLIRENELIEQMTLIYKYFKINLEYDPTIARCPECNSKIQKIEDKEIYKEKIPEKVYEFDQDFWICSNQDCNKIYWIGSHFDEIFQKLHTIKNNNN